MVTKDTVKGESQALPQLLNQLDLNSLFPLNDSSGQNASVRLSSPRVARTLPSVPTSASVGASRRPGGELAAMTARSRAVAIAPRKAGAVHVVSSARPAYAEDASQLEQLTIQNARLQQELQSLREMYARHIAHTELKCEGLMREKESECTNWFKNKRLDIKDMQAAVVVMQALFEKRRRRLAAELDAERDKLTKRQEAFQEQVTQLEKCRENDAQKFKERLEVVQAAHAAELADAVQQRSELADRAHRLEQQLDEARREQESLRETNRQKTQELEKTKTRLFEIERNANVDQRDEKIKSLETELEMLKHTFRERWKKEVESLQQELMDYVRFIVHILPDNWLDSEAAENVPADLRASVNRMQNSYPSGRSKAALQARTLY